MYLNVTKIVDGFFSIFILKVGRKLENLELDKMEDIFDNQFDPRADERKKKLYEKTKKDKFGLDPFGDDFMNEVLVSIGSIHSKFSF